MSEHASRFAVLWALAAMGPAHAQPTGVQVEIDGASIDWVRWKLVVTAESERSVGAWQDQRIREQDAVDRLGPLVAAAARQVPLTPDTDAGDLLAKDTPLAHRLNDGLRDWTIAETRYREGGRVEMDAELDLRTWLGPALAEFADAAPATPESATGLLVDVRGLPFRPCAAPRLMTASGEELTSAQKLDPDVARRQTGVVYVADPADEIGVNRAGVAPLMARPTRVQGCEMSLGPADASLALHPDLSAIAAGGRVVVVTGL
jgi:hypothetical protein